MKEIYVLYLIVHKNRKLLKIGKTKRSYQNTRYYNIDKDFKGASFEKSYYIESPKQEEIDSLERILHKMFYKERKKEAFKTGAGKTEWFKLEVLPRVLKETNHLRKNNPNFSHLSKPIAKIKKESSYKQEKIFPIGKVFVPIFSIVFHLYFLYQI